MPPLVRKASIWQRLKSQLDPQELALSIAEELNDDKYYELLEKAAIPVAVTLNVLFILLRNAAKVEDDVFGDSSRNQLLAVLYTSLLYGLAAVSGLNALFTLTRQKQYQLLQQSIDEVPSTPNAKRVLIDFGNGKEEVWQVNVWQPTRFGLKTFIYFSPMHVLLYYLILPSTKAHALTCGLLGLAISAQFDFMQNAFMRQAQDTKIIHGQVLHEYDTKFVQPLMHRAVRDVGVQATPQGRWTVDAYSPGVQVNRGTGHLNYTPTSLTKDHGTNTPRSLANGHTPTPAPNGSLMSHLKQRPGRKSESLTPAFKPNSSYRSSPLISNNRPMDESEGDEIVVKVSPQYRRKSFRPNK